MFLKKRQMLLLPFPVAAEVSDIFWSGIIMTLQNKNIQVLIAEIFIANLKKWKLPPTPPNWKKTHNIEPISVRKYCWISTNCTLYTSNRYFNFRVDTNLSPGWHSGPALNILHEKKYKNENVTVHTHLIFNLIKGINIFPYFPI